MPFRRRRRIELANDSSRPLPLYYQLAFTLGPEPDDAGLPFELALAGLTPAAPGATATRC